MDKEFFMDLAFKKAFEYIFLTYPNPAVGAVVVKKGAILAIEAHQKAGTSHAEVLALLKAYEHLSGKTIDFDRMDAQKAHEFLLSLDKELFKECELFVTLEPCSHVGKTPSCAMLLSHFQWKKIYIGTLDPIKAHSGGVKMLQSKKIEVEVGLLQEKCNILIEPFIIWQKRAFVLFKLAQSLNGKIGGGYISSQESLTYTHKLRNVADAMIIGGNTVRVDRPKLDCRFISAKAPDVYIYSKKKKFDMTIPLFNVKERSVYIIDTLKILQNRGFYLVEGGEGMLKALKNHIDWLLIFLAPKLIANEISYNIDSSLRFLHMQKNSKDILIWSRFLG